MRRAGLRGIRARQRLEERSGDRGEKLLSEQMEHVEKQLVAFKGHLEDFSKQYRDEIKKDPVFRAQFATMCSKIGVDPLSSGKGFWGELLVSRVNWGVGRDRRGLGEARCGDAGRFGSTPEAPCFSFCKRSFPRHALTHPRIRLSSTRGSVRSTTSSGSRSVVGSSIVHQARP